ncbi:MAG: 50S ribosomal protein L11 methyltransferase [Gammaproteobacteria bacterium]
MSWVQFSIEVDGEQVEVATEAFSAAGALSVSVVDAGAEPLLEPAPGATPLWAATRVTALFADDVDRARVERAIQAAFPVTEPGLSVERLADRDWSSTWRDSFHAMRFGEHLWICPVGEVPPDPQAVVVQMDPGLAFGTGTHATTALCLEWLDASPPRAETVIDYGCGSGILGIAACKLGASRVRAVDIDPQALTATRVNAVRNRVAPQIDVLLPDQLDKQPAHLVLANILAGPLIELAPTLAGLVSAQGQLLLTGILAEQGEGVMSAYRRWFDFRPPVQREEWVLLAGNKVAAD